MTLEEAIAWLMERGLPAKAWDWAGGESILVWDKTVPGPKGTTLRTGGVHLYPDDRNPDTEQWVLDFMYVPGPSFTTHPNLRAVCEAARQYIEAQRKKREEKENA